MCIRDSVCWVAASLVGGNMVQANSIATSLEASFGWDRLAVGAVTALLTGLVILGGIGRIGRVSETLVPAMAVLFLAGGAAVLWVHATAVPAALSRIVASAFAPKAALGGTLGYSMASVMRFGVARGCLLYTSQKRHVRIPPRTRGRRTGPQRCA